MGGEESTPNDETNDQAPFAGPGEGREVNVSIELLSKAGRSELLTEANPAPARSFYPQKHRDWVSSLDLWTLVENSSAPRFCCYLRLNDHG